MLDSARPRLVTDDAGLGSALGVGVSGCELWGRAVRAVMGEDCEERARGSAIRGGAGQGAGRLFVADGDPRPRGRPGSPATRRPGQL